MTRQFLSILYYFVIMIKEVILGKASIFEAYRYDPRRVYILVIIVFSMVLNVFTVMALVSAIKEAREMREVITTVYALEKELGGAVLLLPPGIEEKYVIKRRIMGPPIDPLGDK